MAPTNREDPLLDYEGLADRLGITLESARAYQSRAVQHRRLAARHGDPNFVRPGDLPAPDHYFGQSPAWRASTIDKWNNERPGRGNMLTPSPTGSIPKVQDALLSV